MPEKIRKDRMLLLEKEMLTILFALEVFYCSILLGATIFGTSTNMDDMQIPIPDCAHQPAPRNKILRLGCWPCQNLKISMSHDFFLASDLSKENLLLSHAFASLASPICQEKVRMPRSTKMQERMRKQACCDSINILDPSDLLQKWQIGKTPNVREVPSGYST